MKEKQKNKFIYRINGQGTGFYLYKEYDMNKSCKKTFGELYENTIIKEKELISLGYNVISIWESDYK